MTTIPVNYGIRGSRPRDHPLAARCIRHGRRSFAILPVGSSAQSIKGAFNPRRFFNSSLDPLFFLPLLHGHPISSLGELHLFPASPLVSTEGYDAKMPRHDCRLLFAHPLSNIVSSTVPPVGLHSAMTPANCLVSRHPATCSRGGL